MRLFRRERRQWGDPGSVDYWIEVMNRAIELGETRAAVERDSLLALAGPQPPREFTDFPVWFGKLWVYHLSPDVRPRGRLAMPC